MTDLGFQVEFIIGFWVTLVAIVLSIGFGVLQFILDTDVVGWVLTVFAGIVALIGVILLAIFGFPYNPHYWKLYSVTGTIENVNTSVQSAGKSISNYYVITLAGHDELFVTENPRILDYKDDRVDLVCHANYVYQGADNYDCNIRSVVR